MFRRIEFAPLEQRHTSVLLTMALALPCLSGCDAMARWQERQRRVAADRAHISIRAFEITPCIVKPGGEAVLRWEVVSAETVSIEPDLGLVGQSGQLTIRPTRDQTYVLTANFGETDRPATCAVQLERPAIPVGPGPAISNVTLVPVVTPSPTTSSPADERWIVTATFQGAQLLASSNEEECEVYVDTSLAGAGQNAQGFIWKSITDGDVSTFHRFNERRMAGNSFSVQVDGDDPISLQFVFYEKDGDYHPCATFGQSFKDVRACPQIDSLADNTWLATTRYPGPYGDQDFLVAYKLTTQRLP